MLPHPSGSNLHTREGEARSTPAGRSPSPSGLGPMPGASAHFPGNVVEPDPGNSGETSTLYASGEYPPRPYGHTADPSAPAAAPAHGTPLTTESSGAQKFRPECPEMVNNHRYLSRHRIPRGPIIMAQRIQRMKHTYEEPSLGGGWIACEHPEGQLYFYNERRRLYTDAWMYDAVNFNRIETFATELHQYITEEGLELPLRTEIVLMVEKDSAIEGGGWYYMVCEDTRSIFWADEVDVQKLTFDHRPIVHESQLRHASEAQYWSACTFVSYLHSFDVKLPRLHASMFPRCGEITQTVIDDLNELLRFFTTDAMTSDSSTAPFPQEQLTQIARIVAGMKPGRHVHSFWAMARWQYFFAYSRFIDCYGQQHARLQRNKSIYEETLLNPEPSLVFAGLSLFLFYTPHRYLEMLENIWVDHTINYKDWSIFMQTVQKDWGETLLPATVLLTANVGVLAIQSLDTNKPSRSFAQIACYISAFLSLGNMIICTILSRQHGSARTTAEDAAIYLANKNEKLLGLKVLALTFSLPSAFFLWGILVFYAALVWVCVHDTTLATAAATGVILALIPLVLFIVIWLDWSEDPYKHSLWRRYFDALKRQHGRSRKQGEKSATAEVSG